MYRSQALKMSSKGDGGGVDNPMNPQIYTEKAWDAIAKLPQYAKKYSTQYAEASLVLRGLLDDGPSGLAQRVIQKAGINYEKIESDLESHLLKMPKISDTSNISMGRTMNDCLAKAGQLKRDFGDQFISVEHLLLAVADTDGITKKVFIDGGSNVTKLKEAVMAIRGTNKVTSRNPEVSYEALKQYSRDLTAAAAEGKLDPVIGRDEEIRRAIQILSRRTKNNPILLGNDFIITFNWKKPIYVM
jgi:ATP-dependent Clp protease ATP-binding subunit ClpB